MRWRKWADRLKQELKLHTEPVAVTFAGAQVPGTASPPGQVSVCQALKKASEGEDVTITTETCGCPGGLVSLGLGQMPPEGREKLVNFLVHKEIVYCSRVVIYRVQPAGPASPTR